MLIYKKCFSWDRMKLKKRRKNTFRPTSDISKNKREREREKEPPTFWLWFTEGEVQLTSEFRRWEQFPSTFELVVPNLRPTLIIRLNNWGQLNNGCLLLGGQPPMKINVLPPWPPVIACTILNLHLQHYTLTLTLNSRPPSGLHSTWILATTACFGYPHYSRHRLFYMTKIG